MIGEIRQNFTEASASVGLILATALHVIVSCNQSGETLRTAPTQLGSHRMSLIARNAKEYRGMTVQ